MSKERKDKIVDERPEYEAPQAMHLTPQFTGTGACDSGSGDSEHCNAGTGASGWACVDGSAADPECMGPGSGATGACSYDGSAASGACTDLGSGVSP